MRLAREAAVVALVLRRIVCHRTRDAVLQVNSLAIPLALPLGCHLAMPKGARLSVSRQPQEVTPDFVLAEDTPECLRRFFLRHQNRRSAHLVTHAGDDHRRRHGVAACHVNLESTTEVALAHVGPQRPVQRTKTAGVAINEIARRVGVASSTVRLTLKRLAAAGLGWPLPPEMTDTALEEQLFTAVGKKQGHRRLAEPDWAAVHRELKRKHVTLQILWDEYIERDPEG